MVREVGYVVAAESSNSGAGFVKKGGGSRSWTLLNSSGQEMVLDVDKYAIMHRVQIHARDLRILDPLLSYPSTILGRERAIVLNLEHIKAIITSEEVLLRDPTDDNIIPILEDFRRRLKPQNDDVEGGGEDDSPFEFLALEVALEAICSFLSARTIELESAIYPALDMLTSKISSRNLDRILKLKSQMTGLTARVQKVRDELEQLLDDDDDMAELYLSRKLSSAASPKSTARDDEKDVEQVEMLLEAYYMQIDTTFNKLTTLREYVDNTEDYINIQLDTHRNQLIQLELFLNAGVITLAVYSLVTAIFGMNIPYPWNENHGYMFKWVVILTGIFCAVLFILIMSYSRYKGLVGS